LPPLVASKDEEHLKLLAIFHYVAAAVGASFACFPLLHVAMGIWMVASPASFNDGQKASAPPAFVGYFFIFIGACFVLMGWSAAICTFISGRFLAKRRKRMFSFVVAAFLCALAPFGTVLGIFTIIVLSRESVQRLYAREAAPPAPSPAT